MFPVSPTPKPRGMPASWPEVASAAGPRSAIQLRLGHIGQLFNSLDPAPFRERGLDQAVEQYILEAARELGGREALEIVVHLPGSELTHPLSAEIVPAIGHHFRHLATAEDSALRELARDGRRALAVGLVIFATCLFLIALIEEYFPYPRLARLAEDSLIILGWVGMWGPLDILLFERGPLLRRRRLYRRLMDASVAIRGFAAEPVPTPSATGDRA
jgi:hypothetical protein